MGSESDPGSRKLSRRDFFKLGGALAVTAGSFYIASQIPFNHELPLEEYDDKFSEALKNYPTRFYYHNAAENPVRLDRALTGPALNIEADVIHFENDLYIAHSSREFRDDLKKHPEYIEEQKADRIFRKIADSGKNPAIDLKLNEKDQDGFNMLMESVTNNIPEDRVVTFSGEPKLVREIIDRPNSIVVPTIFQPRQIPEYRNHAEKNWQNVDPNLVRFGATINHRFNNYDLVELITYNRYRQYETNAYTVNNEERIEELLRLGITGITSDNEQILMRANSIVR